MQITVNETGARTIADSRPMRIDGQNVYVVLDSSASLFVGGRLVDVRPVSEIRNATEAQAWAVSYRDGLTAVEEAVIHVAAVYAEVVARVQGEAAELLAEAAECGAHGEGDCKRRSSLNGRWITYTSNDPRHPARRAEHLRSAADRLANWTATDEIAYGRYVDDGISATDGYYAPEGRAAWKVTLGA